MPFPPLEETEGFITDCLQVLNSASAGTAIYMLSSFCPEDFTIVLDVLRIDLSQPHLHQLRRKNQGYAGSSSYTDVIASMRAYTQTLSRDERSHVWLELVQRWLLTCPLDQEYYQHNETGKDGFCLKLRSDLVDSIMRFD